jgi:hypothetical protein
MPKGEKVLAQSKRTAPPPIFQNLKGLEMMNFPIGILFLIEFQIGTPSSKKLMSKTLLNTKRRILLRGEFCLVKRKAFETGGENFKS